MRRHAASTAPSVATPVAVLKQKQTSCSSCALMVFHRDARRRGRPPDEGPVW